MFLVVHRVLLSLQSHLKVREDKKIPLIYKKHTLDEGLIESYSKNINEAVRERDKIAVKSIKYMFDKIKNINF